MSEIKFMKKPTMISLEDWQKELNLECKKGWKVIQIFNAPDGKLTVMLRKDD